jgi:hypothetical protein
VVMHKHPETSWSLEELAQHAGMSRARFAAHFRKVVGVTPFDYLTDWRLGIAQTPEATPAPAPVGCCSRSRCGVPTLSRCDQPELRRHVPRSATR